MGAATTGLTAGNDVVTIVYGDLVASQNHDCPDASAPSVEPLTIMGTQVGGGAGLFTVCIPRPDLLATMAQPLGNSGVHLVDATGTDSNGCTYMNQAAFIPTGTVSSQGMCDSGANKAGFALVFDAGLGLTRTCGTNIDQQVITLRGTIAVAFQ